MRNRPLIGLDIDGVLNTTATQPKRPDKFSGADLDLSTVTSFVGQKWLLSQLPRFHPPALAALRHLLKETGAHVLMTTNHRYFFELNSKEPVRHFNEALATLVPGVVVAGLTPVLQEEVSGGKRGQSIAAWFRTEKGREYHPELFLGLDDLGRDSDDSPPTVDYEPFEDQLVLVTPSKGLTMGDAQEAITRLQRVSDALFPRDQLFERSVEWLRGHQ